MVASKKRKLLRSQGRAGEDEEPAGDAGAEPKAGRGGPKRRRQQEPDAESKPKSQGRAGEDEEPAGDAGAEPKAGRGGPKRRRQQEPDAESKPKKTKVDPTSVFIRGLPATTTDATLRRWLEVQIGPTVTCFVIRGDYGLATFKSEDDAGRCLKELQGVEFEGRQLRLEAAKPKRRTSKLASKDTAASKTGTAAAKSEQQKMDLRSVQLSGVPGSVKKKAVQAWIERRLPGGCGIEAVKSVLGTEGTFVVQFRKESNARRAVAALTGATLQGHRVNATFRALALSREASKAGRLIVRNLAFSATEKHVRQAFASMGELVEVHLPTKEGTSENRGFAFVQFADLAVADRAVAELNGSKICGRGVAVDWAVDSKLYSSLKRDEVQKAPKSGKETADRGPARRVGGKEERAEEPKEEVEEEVDDEEEQEEEAVEGEGEDEEDQEEEREQKEDREAEEEEEEPGGQGEEAGPVDTAAELQHMKHLLGEGGEDAEAPKKADDNQQEKKQPGFDVDEMRTLFVRNVPFDATADDLREVLSKYGKIIFVNTVADPKGENPHRGTAFVKFVDVESAKKVLEIEEQANEKLNAVVAVRSRRNRERELPAVEGFGISLKGRRLLLAQAVTPKQVVAAQKDRKPKKGEALREKAKWKYLFSIGDIDENSDEWEKLSKSEQLQRLASRKERSWRMGNSNFFLHPNRLSVRNLPQRVDASTLRGVIAKHLSTCELEGMSWGKASSKKERLMAAQKFITKASLVRSNDRRTADNVRRSRGFAFIEFSTHDAAMQTLEFLNNNSEAFGGPKKPIVQFAIEDKRKLKMQQELFEKHGHKLLENKAAGESAKRKKRKKKEGMGRGARQREKRRLQKAEAALKEKAAAERAAKQEKYVEKKRQEKEIKKKFSGKPVKTIGDAEASAKKRPEWELKDDFELKALDKFRRG